MGFSESSGASASRQPLRLSIPDAEEIAGFRETACCVKPLFDLEAVEIKVEDGPELVFSQAATVDLIMRLVAAIARLRNWEGER